MTSSDAQKERDRLVELLERYPEAMLKAASWAMSPKPILNLIFPEVIRAVREADIVYLTAAACSESLDGARTKAQVLVGQQPFSQIWPNKAQIWVTEFASHLDSREEVGPQELDSPHSCYVRVVIPMSVPFLDDPNASCLIVGHVYQPAGSLENPARSEENFLAALPKMRLMPPLVECMVVPTTQMAFWESHLEYIQARIADKAPDVRLSSGRSFFRVEP